MFPQDYRLECLKLAVSGGADLSVKNVLAAAQAF
jgi:hypothetical protein